MARRPTTVSGPRPQPGHIEPNPAPLAAEVERCGLCWVFLKDDDSPTGVCRHGPPRSGQTAGNWPAVRVSDWCGKFKRRDA